MQHLFGIALLFVAARFATHTYGQAATSPAAAGPTNITAVLEKAGQFSTFIRLMRSTQEESQINNQLNNSNSGLTVFAPTDNAFSSLPSGSLNALTDQQKVSLVQFHILPAAYSSSQLQTVSNPVRTQAGNADYGYQLNVTSNGAQVNISTGVVSATVDNTLYSSQDLVVYQLRTVLLPEAIYGSPAPAAAPAPGQPEGDKPTSAAHSPSAASTDATTTSAAADADWPHHVIVAFAAAAASLWLSF